MKMIAQICLHSSLRDGLESRREHVRKNRQRETYHQDCNSRDDCPLALAQLNSALWRRIRSRSSAGSFMLAESRDVFLVHRSQSVKRLPRAPEIAARVQSRFRRRATSRQTEA